MYAAYSDDTIDFYQSVSQSQNTYTVPNESAGCHHVTWHSCLHYECWM